VVAIASQAMLVVGHGNTPKHEWKEGEMESEQRIDVCDTKLFTASFRQSAKATIETVV